MMVNRTCVVVAHRLSTIQKVDSIVVIMNRKLWNITAITSLITSNRETKFSQPPSSMSSPSPSPSHSNPPLEVPEPYPHSLEHQELNCLSSNTPAPIFIESVTTSPKLHLSTLQDHPSSLSKPQ
ncbi:hypothetical protein V6N12_036008 [Hibiscus sabdariffa]|uniref:Uncharacterized protein n=1 Tax=Hibiscus sabdariffa TaxID=183260 RepID=A0ABR2EPD3_9ROSI